MYAAKWVPSRDARVPRWKSATVEDLGSDKDSRFKQTRSYRRGRRHSTGSVTRSRDRDQGRIRAGRERASRRESGEDATDLHAAPFANAGRGRNAALVEHRCDGPPRRCPGLLCLLDLRLEQRRGLRSVGLVSRCARLRGRRHATISAELFLRSSERGLGSPGSGRAHPPQQRPRCRPSGDSRS